MYKVDWNAGEYPFQGLRTLPGVCAFQSRHMVRQGRDQYKLRHGRISDAFPGVWDRADLAGQQVYQAGPGWWRVPPLRVWLTAEQSVAVN